MLLNDKAEIRVNCRKSGKEPCQPQAKPMKSRFTLPLSLWMVKSSKPMAIETIPQFNWTE
jgi:hypothetical protein